MSNRILNWDQYFMNIALLSSYRSKDPNTRVGACIINGDNNRILSIGYNGMPNNIPDEKLTWKKGDNWTNNKKFYVVHAELNAILNYQASFDSVSNKVLYTTLFPCNECMKAIIQTGISKIIYLYDDQKGKDSDCAARYMAMQAGIELVELKNCPRLEI